MPEPQHASFNIEFTENLHTRAILSLIDGITLPKPLTFSRLPTRPGDTKARPLRVGFHPSKIYAVFLVTFPVFLTV